MFLIVGLATADLIALLAVRIVPVERKDWF